MMILSGEFFSDEELVAFNRTRTWKLGGECPSGDEKNSVVTCILSAKVSSASNLKPIFLSRL